MAASKVNFLNLRFKQHDLKHHVACLSEVFCFKPPPQVCKCVPNGCLPFSLQEHKIGHLFYEFARFQVLFHMITNKCDTSLKEHTG